MKVPVLIEIPDGYELIKAEAQLPKKGESYLCINDGVIYEAAFDYSEEKHVIVRKQWQWPSWLKARWIAMDNTGEWYAWICNKPHIEDTKMWLAQGYCRLDCGHFDFTPPPCTDWTQSLMENPNVQ